MFLSLTILIVAFSIIYAQREFSKLSSAPGSFARESFSPRAAALGEALSATIDQRIEAFFNPALGAFQNKNFLVFGKGFLSLDRFSNYVFFGRSFKFSKTEEDNFRSAGFYAGLLNCGVSDIDVRDNDGFKKKTYSTSENLFFASLSNRFSEKVSLGITIRYYYYYLYEKISSESVGFDIGAIYLYNDNLNFSIVIKDINSKYKWDSSPIYGIDGRNSIEKFPVFKIFGVAYKTLNKRLLLVAQFENSNYNSNRLSFGSEYSFNDVFFIRGGLSSFDLSNSDIPLKYSFGFGASYGYEQIIAFIDYSFYYENYSSSLQHLIGISINF